MSNRSGMQTPNFYCYIARQIDGFWTIFNSALDGVWDLLHSGKIVRRAAFILMWWITFQAFHFCFDAAEKSNWDPATIGACFAILTPVSALQAAIMKFYNDSRAADLAAMKK